VVVRYRPDAASSTVRYWPVADVTYTRNDVAVGLYRHATPAQQVKWLSGVTTGAQPSPGADVGESRCRRARARACVSVAWQHAGVEGRKGGRRTQQGGGSHPEPRTCRRSRRVRRCRSACRRSARSKCPRPVDESESEAMRTERIHEEDNRRSMHSFIRGYKTRALDRGRPPAAVLARERAARVDQRRARVVRCWRVGCPPCIVLQPRCRPQHAARSQCEQPGVAWTPRTVHRFRHACIGRVPGVACVGVSRGKAARLGGLRRRARWCRSARGSSRGRAPTTPSPRSDRLHPPKREPPGPVYVLKKAAHWL
jgi:hypothetical protein